MFISPLRCHDYRNGFCAGRSAGWQYFLNLQIASIERCLAEQAFCTRFFEPFCGTNAMSFLTRQLSTAALQRESPWDYRNICHHSVTVITILMTMRICWQE